MFALVVPSELSNFYWFKLHFFQRKGVDRDLVNLVFPVFQEVICIIDKEKQYQPTFALMVPSEVSDSFGFKHFLLKRGDLFKFCGFPFPEDLCDTDGKTVSYVRLSGFKKTSNFCCT